MKNPGLALLWLDAHSGKDVQKILAAANEQQTTELNQKLVDATDNEMQKLCGALEIEPVSSVEDTLCIADNLDAFEYFPDVTTERELGIYLVESGMMDFPENVRDYLDYTRIGTEYHANHSGTFMDTGYVTRQHEQALGFEKQQGFGMRMR